MEIKELEVELRGAQQNVTYWQAEFAKAQTLQTKWTGIAEYLAQRIADEKAKAEKAKEPEKPKPGKPSLN